MIADLKPYPEYKDSGLPWVEELPQGWIVRRGRGVFESIDVRSKTGKEELLTVSSQDGVRLRSSKAVTMFQAKSYVGHKLCWPGDLVVNSLWAWATGLGFSRHYGIVSTAYGVYRPRDEHKAKWRFLDYLLRSYAYKWEFQTRSRGIWISRLQLTDWYFFDMPILLPPEEDAEAIVRFLDHANGKIDRYVRAKKKLIKLLNEQKQAIIHRAVTRGLPSTGSGQATPMKDSGIPWLGKIPEHWGEITVRAATRLIQTGPFGSQIHQHEYTVGGTALINPSHMKNGKIVPDLNTSVLPAKAEELSRHKLMPGDVVVARRGELGRSAVVTEEHKGCLCGTGSLLVRLGPAVFEPEYFQLLFSSPAVTGLLCSASIGATMDNLNAGMVGSLRFPRPPKDDQVAIINMIQIETEQCAAAITRTEREIELLNEYRTKLTADVVTGKLDVREAAKVLPEELVVESDGADSTDETDLSDDADEVLQEEES